MVGIILSIFGIVLYRIQKVGTGQLQPDALKSPNFEWSDFGSPLFFEIFRYKDPLSGLFKGWISISLALAINRPVTGCFATVLNFDLNVNYVGLQTPDVSFTNTKSFCIDIFNTKTKYERICPLASRILQKHTCIFKYILFFQSFFFIFLQIL